jgi:hypothetical protein
MEIAFNLIGSDRNLVSAIMLLSSKLGIGHPVEAVFILVRNKFLTFR